MTTSREAFGREVLGPITAEFCLRLWCLGEQLDRPDEAAMLFCARGGLRILAAYERFLERTRLRAPTLATSLMVSRVVAIRPVLVRAADEGEMPHSAVAALNYEFSRRSSRAVLKAMSGCDVGVEGDVAFTPKGATRLLRAPEGHDALAALREQADLFRTHLAIALKGRRSAILVDTGLFGSTLQFLSDSVPDVAFSCALIARANYREPVSSTDHYARTFGLGVEVDCYSPFNCRSAILRYWHLVESTFEPDLPSVRVFANRGGVPISNLEVSGWRDRVAPERGTIFAGVMAYLDGLSHGDAACVDSEAERAWRKLYLAFVWPRRELGEALDVGIRSHDFGVNETSAARPWRGPLHALRGHALWREGEISRSASFLRLPLLAAIEAVYGARNVKRIFTAKIRRGWSA